MPNTYAQYIQRVDKTDHQKKHENMHLTLDPLIVVFSSKQPLSISFKDKGTSVINRKPGVTFYQNSTVLSFRLFNLLLKNCIKSCRGAAASPLNIPWKSKKFILKRHSWCG